MHEKFGPHIIEDIILDLSKEEVEKRKEEIWNAVYQVFDRELSKIKRYCGTVVR